MYMLLASARVKALVARQGFPYCRAETRITPGLHYDQLIVGMRQGFCKYAHEYDSSKVPSTTRNP